MTAVGIRAAPRRGHLWELVAVSAGLAVYGNVGTTASFQLYPWSLFSAFGHPLLVVGVVLWARRRAGLSWTDMGLGRAGWPRSALLGLALGLAVVGGTAILIFLARALGWASSTQFPRPADLGAVAGLALQLFIGTALCEELWFRGVLLEGWTRALGPVRGVAVTCGWFVLWHLTIWTWTLTQVTTTPPLPWALTWPFGLLCFFIGGAFFSALRLGTKHLLGAVVAHGVLDILLVGFVYLGWL